MERLLQELGCHRGIAPDGLLFDICSALDAIDRAAEVARPALGAIHGEFHAALTAVERTERVDGAAFRAEDAIKVFLFGLKVVDRAAEGALYFSATGGNVQRAAAGLTIVINGFRQLASEEC